MNEIVNKNGQKSTKSNSGDCVRVKIENVRLDVDCDARELVVLTEDESDGRVRTTREKFQAFIDGVKAGEFDKFGGGQLALGDVHST